MIREVSVGGGGMISGFEAGVSLYGFDRDGIYVDMNTPGDAVPHLVAHEMVHQGEIVISGFVMTSDGLQLHYEEKT